MEEIVCRLIAEIASSLRGYDLKDEHGRQKAAHDALHSTLVSLRDEGIIRNEVFQEMNEHVGRWV